MTRLHCRLFYCLAILCCALLLAPTTGTVFLALCCSCVTLPLYRFYKAFGLRKLRHLPKTKKVMRALWTRLPFYGYSLSVFFAIAIPIAIMVLLVTPQASRGLEQLKTMRVTEKLNLLMPDNIRHFVDSHFPSLADYPALENVVKDITRNAEEYFNAFLSNLLAPNALWHRAVGVLGGSFTALWTVFLFFILTFLFTAYAKQGRSITQTVLALPLSTLQRFIEAIRRALNAILLGIVVVAFLQGILCGIGFAVAGIESYAFWGLMAAFVAPIPFIGTLLVWGPLALVLWFKGAHFAAIGLALWGTVAVAGVDNICRPLFLKQGIKAPFFVLILSIICGTTVFGPLGIVAGPVLLAFSLQLIEESTCTLVKKALSHGQTPDTPPK